MKRIFAVAILMVLVNIRVSLAQISGSDTTFIRPYEQNILLTGYISTDALELQKGSRLYKPNNPLNIGAGVSVKNTVINFMIDYGFIPLKGSNYGKTNLTDIQIQNYGKHLMLNLFIQRYKGFYDPVAHQSEITTYPNLAVSQIGSEITYVFNSSRFSAKAAFEQSEIQLKSAGSFLIGGAIYFQKLGLDSTMLISGERSINNLQAGLNAGYGYARVLDKRWQISGIVKVGGNGTMEPEVNGANKFKFYPTAYAKAATAYQKPAWAIVFQMRINNKSILGFENRYQVTSINFQLAYVRHLNHTFKKKPQ